MRRFANYTIMFYINLMTREYLLRTIADPNRRLPEVRLEYAGRSVDQDMYIALSSDRQIGTMKLGSVNSRDAFVVQGSGVDERLKGHGYGLAMYLGAAALAYELGYRLKSDSMVSRDAARVWGRLARCGLARVLTPFRWREREQYSQAGHPLFVPSEELSLPDPVRRMEDDDDIWQRM